MMKVISRLAPVVLIATLVLIASCTATKKYGCPDSLATNYSTGR